MIDLWFGLNDWTRFAIIIAVAGTVLLFVMAHALDKIFPNTRKTMPKAGVLKKDTGVTPKYYIECAHCGKPAIYMIEDLAYGDIIKANNFVLSNGFQPEANELIKCQVCHMDIEFYEKYKKENKQ